MRRHFGEFPACEVINAMADGLMTDRFVVHLVDASGYFLVGLDEVPDGAAPVVGLEEDVGPGTGISVPTVGS